MRAFLMHSSVDKRFVDEVASGLGRNNIIYDRFSFSPGQEIEGSIQELLPTASVGILFASAASLKSSWVRKELSLAKQLVRSGRHLALVTLVLDDTPIDALPPLAQKYLCVHVASAYQAVRIIQSQLRSSASYSAIRPLFMGREQDLEMLSGLLHENKVPVKLICLSGLDGIGRRTLASHVLRNYLATAVGPELTLDGYDGLDRLYIQAKELSGAISSRKDLERTIREASNTNSPEFSDRLASSLQALMLPNEALVLTDNGSLFTEQGAFMPAFVRVLRSSFRNPAFMMVLVSRRRPRLRELGEIQRHIVEHPVRPLALDKTELLLSRGLESVGISANPEQVRELARYIDGYPPAVRLAVEQAQRYGLANIIANKAYLSDYKARQFSPILERLATLEQHRRILRAIGSGVYITTEVLSRHLSIRVQECASLLQDLLDMSLIVPGESNTYYLQRPIKDAVTRSFGFLSPSEYAQGAKILRELYWDDLSIPPFEILNAITLSAAYIEDSGFASVTIPSTLLRAAENAYNAREWERAISLCRKVIELAPDRLRAREILAKGYIREESWSEAAEQTAILRKAGYPRVEHIEGFLELKRGHFQKAEEFFRAAMRKGDTSISVVRDRANCLVRLGRHGDARRLLDQLSAFAWQNRYVLDLAAQIAIELKDYDTAESYIATLRHLGESYDANHRQAAMLIKRRRPREALKLLGTLDKGARFETWAMRADCLIEIGKFDEAQQAIKELRPQTSGNRDVVDGLRCKLALREGDTNLARLHYEKIRNKDLPVHRALREEIRRQAAGAARKTAAADLELLYPFLSEDQHGGGLEELADQSELKSKIAEPRGLSRRTRHWQRKSK